MIRFFGLVILTAREDRRRHSQIMEAGMALGRIQERLQGDPEAPEGRRRGRHGHLWPVN